MHRSSKCRLFRRIFDERGGNVLILTALGILVLVAVAGAGIDLGRQQLLRARMQQSTDAAALAAGSLPSPYGDPAQTDQFKRDTANRYFNLNFTPSYLGFQRPTPSVQATDNSTVSTGGTLRTQFVNQAGVSTTEADARSVVTAGDASQAKDILLVMDNSSSMCDNIKDRFVDCDSSSKMALLKSAAREIARTLLADNPLHNRVGAITWSDGVRGTQPFTESFPTISRFIDKMRGNGGTNSSTGMNAALSMMQSNTRTDSVKVVVLLTDGINKVRFCCGPEQMNPLTLNTCKTLKDSGTVVYTIGFGNFITQPCTTFICNVSRCSEDNFCSSKAPPNYYSASSYRYCTYRDRPQFYPFDVVGPNASTYCPREMLTECASSPDHFYLAPDAAALQRAFKSITTSVGKLRISE